MLYAMLFDHDESKGNMTLSVHFGYSPKAESLAYLRDQLHESIKLTDGDIPETPDYDILISGRPKREELQASPNVKKLIIPWAGLPTVTRDLMMDFPQIDIHNLHHNAPPTAEMALALLMSVAKTLHPADREFRKHDWTPRYTPYPARLLYRKTALILGYGSIGEHLGAVLRALGMTVIGTRRTNIDEANGIYAADKLHNLLQRADILIIALPATPETEGLIGAEEIALLPDQTILINVGRAVVVDQHALYDALTNGKLFGAGLDVWYHYPPDVEARTHTPPADVPFHELDNVVMSPHRAGDGANPEVDQLRMDDLAAILNAAAQGENLPHQVDLQAGY